MSKKPMKGGMVENIMKYILKFLYLLVTRPMNTKYSTESTLLGMSSNMTCRFVNPKEVLMIWPNVVRPPAKC